MNLSKDWMQVFPNRLYHTCDWEAGIQNGAPDTNFWCASDREVQGSGACFVGVFGSRSKLPNLKHTLPIMRSERATVESGAPHAKVYAPAKANSEANMCIHRNLN
jgi:hypothetical protein